MEYLVILVQLVLKESLAHAHHLEAVNLETQEEKEQKGSEEFMEILVLEDLEASLAFLGQ